MKSWLMPVLRMAARDGRSIMERPAYLLAAAGPLILVFFLGFIIFVAALILSVVQVADLDSQPMGTGKGALVLDVDLGELRGDAEVIAAEIQRLDVEGVEGPMGVVGWIDRIKRYVVASREGAPEGAGDTEGEGDDPINWVEVTDDELGPVPGLADAALRITLNPEGRLAYEIIDDTAILYSRVMGRRLEGAVDRFNQASGGPGALALTLEDDALPEVDLWVAYALMLIWSLGVAYTYHGVAVQSVASLLAGEREQRTLDVILTLPITRTQLVWGKLLALTMAILTPSALWVLLGVLMGWWILGIWASFGALVLLGGALILPLTAVGCTISATAPSVLAAQNRLGFANLGVLLFGVGGLFLAKGVGLGNDTLLGALVLGAQGEAWGWVLLILAGSVCISALLVQVAARGLRP